MAFPTLLCPLLPDAHHCSLLHLDVRSRDVGWLYVGVIWKTCVFLRVNQKECNDVQNSANHQPNSCQKHEVAHHGVQSECAQAKDEVCAYIM